MKTPKLRFEGYTDEWEEKKLGEIAENINGGGTPKTSNMSYWDGDIPWIQSSDLCKDSVSKIVVNKYINNDALNNSSAKLIEQNSIAIVSRVGVGKVVKVPFDYATSQDFLSLSKIDGNIDFWTYTIKNLMRIESHYLQGTSIKGITKDEILNIHCYSPSLPEQEKIGSFLSKIDERIELEEKKLELFKERKRGWMQKLFNQEIRFKDENGNDYPDWEEKKLGKVVNWHKGSSLTKETLNLDKKGVRAIHYADIYKFKEVSRESIHYTEEVDGVELYENDLIFPMSDVTPRGLAKVVSIQYTALAGGDVLIARLHDDKPVNSMFLSYFINYNKKEIYKYVTGTTVKHINAKDLSKLVVAIPYLLEQQKIADFLFKQDELISAQEEKVSLLKEQKKGLLQQMFV